MKINTSKTVKANKDSVRIVIAIQYCVTAILLILCLLYELFEPSPESVIYPCCCLLSVVLIWSFFSWYVLTVSLFNPYLLFLLSAFIFNGGQAILEVFHLNYGGSILAAFKISPDTLVNTLFFVSLGLCSFHLGALISAANEQSNFPAYDQKKEALVANSRASYLVGWVLLSISFFPTIFVLQKTASIVLTYGYAGIYQQEAATSFNTIPEILGAFIVPASMFILAGSKQKQSGRLISLTLIIVYTTIRFLLGQRTQGILPLISYAWLWHQFIHPIPKTFLFGIGFLMLSVVFPLIAITRNIVGEDRLSIEFLLENYKSIENPVIAGISEMGGSMLTVCYTLELVPSVREYQMGAEYFYALLTLVPNFFGKLHPSIARGIPDVWLVEQVDPNFARDSGSYGFSFIAEAYLNFGWVGGLIALGVKGFLFAKLTFWGIRFMNPAKMAMIGSFLSFFLFYPRGESVFMVRPLVWYSLLPYLGVYLLTTSWSRKLAR